MAMSEVRRARYGALIRSAERWRGVSMLNRSRGNTEHADDEAQIVRRITAVLDLLRIDDTGHEHHLDDAFIKAHARDSANEFVAAVEAAFRGKIPGCATESPAALRARQPKRLRGQS